MCHFYKNITDRGHEVFRHEDVADLHAVVDWVRDLQKKEKEKEKKYFRHEDAANLHAVVEKMNLKNELKSPYAPPQGRCRGSYISVSISIAINSF